ncbi:MAG: cation:proton antiporter [Chitinispirillaceae bacterium]|nr:cation:proton antiporter [Chitinispirillaceae bacterium]
MNSVLIIGLIISTGFLFGELAQRIKLPRVTGFIIAGLALNPSITHLLPDSVLEHTGPTTDIALAFITFSVGGVLSIVKLRALGRSVMLITLFEAEGAFIVISVCFAGLLWFVPLFGPGSWLSFGLPFALLLGSLGCPTDPSATLAVAHEYKAEGKISSTILSVAGLDDVLGLLTFTVAVSAAGILMTAASVHPVVALFNAAVSLGGAVLVGTAFGLLLIGGLRLIDRETEGAHIVVVLAALTLCYGLSTVLRFDTLFATMVMGMIVVNLSRHRDSVFRLLERYTDELVFVLFFTISAMHLDFGQVSTAVIPVLFFIVLRFIGKTSGTLAGGRMSGFSARDSLRTSLGLIPQGGIVIGLALSLAARPEFKALSHTLIAVVMGATIVHEIAGPMLAVAAIRAAGEIPLANMSKIKKLQQPHTE